MKNKTLLFISITTICIFSLILLLFHNKNINSSSRFDRNLFIGKWTGKYDIEFKVDSTFVFSCFHSLQYLSGEWALTDIYFNKDTMTLLVLRNLRKPESERDEWFSNYFLEIEKISDNSMTFKDLSAIYSGRRNYLHEVQKK